jgi:hypothetical protein
MELVFALPGSLAALRSTPDLRSLATSILRAPARRLIATGRPQATTNKSRKEKMTAEKPGVKKTEKLKGKDLENSHCIPPPADLFRDWPDSHRHGEKFHYREGLCWRRRGFV